MASESPRRCKVAIFIQDRRTVAAGIEIFRVIRPLLRMSNLLGGKILMARIFDLVLEAKYLEARPVH
ncbi:hypothetical protein Plhal304r1_c013g0048761 [Plasmopara halstedii]